MKNESNILLQPVQTRRASEEIYDQIRQLILDGKIKPGERLPSERNMMEMMHRSRPTIREASECWNGKAISRSIPAAAGPLFRKLAWKNAVQSLETIMLFQQLTMENILEFRRMTEGIAAGWPPGAAQNQIWQKWPGFFARQSRRWVMNPALLHVICNFIWQWQRLRRTICIPLCFRFAGE